MEQKSVTPTSIFYGSLCHVCKQFSHNLKRCSACKTLAYCSKDHQKQDWAEHKQFCKIITVTNSTITYKIGCSLDEWKQYRTKLHSQWRMLLKRELLPYEFQMWMFPRVCAQCFSKTGLNDCSGCFSVAYCSREHEQSQKNAHEPICGKLRLCLEIDRYLICNKKHCPIIECLPHSGEQVGFPRDMSEFLKHHFFTENHLDYILRSDGYTTFCTLAFVIEKLKIFEENLVVHVVGADLFEGSTDWSAISQNIFHCFPQVKSVEWILVGPAAQYLPMETNRVLCSTCLAQKRCFNIKTHKKMYEDVIDELPIPHLVVALNSGIHEFEGVECDTWKTSISCLLKYTGVPLLLTAYTKQEILKDLRCIADCVNVEVLMEAQVNPHASLRPIRDWDNDVAAVSVFFVNGYFAVIQKHS